LTKYGNQYTDEQVLAIRDFLYEVGQIDYEVFIYNERKEALRKMEDEKIKTLTENNSEEDESQKNAA
jgi:hypothetical protein